MGHEIPSFSPFLIDKLYIGMRDDDDTQSRLTNRMDDAFCSRMCAAIEAGLESAPIGVVTTPGTQHPKLAGRYGAHPAPHPTTTDS